MNFFQKLALLVGVVLALGAVLYPSYEVGVELRAGYAGETSAEEWPVMFEGRSVVRHFAALPGSPRFTDDDGLIDAYKTNEKMDVGIARHVEPLHANTAIEVLAIALATGVVMFLLRSRVLKLRNGDGSMVGAKRSPDSGAPSATS